MIKNWYQVDQVEEEEVAALKRKVAELESALAQNHRGGREVNLLKIYNLSMNEWMNEWMNHNNGNIRPEGVWYQFRVWQVWNFKTNQRETLIDGDYWRRVRNCNDGDCPEKIMISQCAKAATEHVRHFLSELYASTLGCAKVILCTTVLVQ